ncbi:MAG TPA: energy transducer TonB [Thermoanaerobaculia bacterium]
MLRPVALIALLFSLSASAQDAASIAMRVKDQPFDAAPVIAALRSPDALTRATAARVLAIRGGDVAALRVALENEKDAEAAREQIRAITLLGKLDDVAFVHGQLSRFPASLDSEFVETIGRRGAPEAIDLYLKYRGSLRDVTAPTRYALWGRHNTIPAVAARLLGHKDSKGFARLLGQAIESGVAAPSGAVAAAITADDVKVREASRWYVVEAYALDPSVMPPLVRETGTAERENLTVSEAYARELLRRMGGAARESKREWLEWLRSKDSKQDFPKAVRAFMTPEEQAAHDGEPDDKLPVVRADGLTTEVRRSPFTLPIKLPRGLGEAMIEKAKCRGTWAGIVTATVDRTGRVQSVDTSRVFGDRRCVDILEPMLRLAYAEPETITSAMTTSELLVVKGKRNVCFNEDAIALADQPELVRVGGDVIAPVVLKRTEPEFPEEVRRSMVTRSLLVIAESIITREGCVRDIRLLGQSPEPQLNASAVLALSEWTFKPGMLNGQVVDVIFNLSVNFKLK